MSSELDFYLNFTMTACFIAGLLVGFMLAAVVSRVLPRLWNTLVWGQKSAESNQERHRPE